MLKLTEEEKHEQVLWMTAMASSLVLEKRKDDQWHLRVMMTDKRVIVKRATTIAEAVFNAMNSDG